MKKTIAENKRTFDVTLGSPKAMPVMTAYMSANIFGLCNRLNKNLDLDMTMLLCSDRHKKLPVCFPIYYIKLSLSRVVCEGVNSVQVVGRTLPHGYNAQTSGRTGGDKLYGLIIAEEAFRKNSPHAPKSSNNILAFQSRNATEIYFLRH